MKGNWSKSVLQIYVLTRESYLMWITLLHITYSILVTQSENIMHTIVIYVKMLNRQIVIGTGSL